MKSLSDYIIKFEGLKQGTHFFEFDVDNQLFEEFDCDEFEELTFKVDLTFEKQSTMMLLTFVFNGKVKVPCDRCLDPVEVEVEGEEKLIVKFGNEIYQETDDILILPEHEYELNVARFIYEFINVNLPQRRIHAEGLCNQNVINAFEKVEQKKEIDIDPRWATLQDINLNKKK